MTLPARVVGGDAPEHAQDEEHQRRHHLVRARARARARVGVRVRVRVRARVRVRVTSW